MLTTYEEIKEDKEKVGKLSLQVFNDLGLKSLRDKADDKEKNKLSKLLQMYTETLIYGVEIETKYIEVYGNAEDWENSAVKALELATILQERNHKQIVENTIDGLIQNTKNISKNN